MIALRSSGASFLPITPLVFGGLSANSWPVFQFPRIEVSNSKPLVSLSYL